MEQFLTPVRDILGLLVQGVILILPIVLSWFVRTFVRSSAAERRVATIVRLSNAAIDYVENLDKRGDLTLPDNVKKGGYKLKLASEWAEHELKRIGVNVTDEEARKWIAAEFQKRIGDLRPSSQLVQVTGAAVDLLQRLEQNQQLQPPVGEDRMSYLAELAADWAVARLMEAGVTVTREEARTWIRAELLQRVEMRLRQVPSAEQLAQLGAQAVEFLERLKANGHIAIQPGGAGEDIETDLATAWLLTEAAKQGLVVSSDQIAQAAAAALRQRRGSSHALIVAGTS